jgi:hypothetical protein
MTKLPPFAVIADAHIADTPGIQDDHLRMALRAAESRHAAFVVIAGDIVEAGRRACYENAAAIIAETSLPCFPLIGNKEASRNTTQGYRSHFGRPYYTVQHSGYRLIMLSTTRFEILPPQMRWLRRTLQETAPHDNTIIVSHHYLRLFPEARRDEFISLCAEFGIKHLIVAHSHNPKVTAYDPLTERVVQAIDPDKALTSLPGFTMVGLAAGELHSEFVPVTLPATQIQRHLVDQLGYAPNTTCTPHEIRDLCAEYPLKSYQLRLGGPDSFGPLARQAEAARECGLQIIGHLPTPEFDEAGAFLNEDHMRRCMQFCAEQSADPVVLHPTKLPADLLTDAYQRLNLKHAATRPILDAYVEMAGQMEDLGIHVALENNSSKKKRTTFGGLPSHLRGLLDYLREAGLHPGFCFDIGHAKGSVASVQIAEWMAALGDDLLCLHIHTGDPHAHTTHEPIEDLFWWTRWYGLAAWLAYRNLTVPCLLELTTPAAVATSLHTLRQLPSTCTGP